MRRWQARNPQVVQVSAEHDVVTAVRLILP